MAGSSVTFTEKTHGSVKLVKAAWVSDDATGAVTGESTYYYEGKLDLLATIPSGGGTAPTDNYDVTVTDANGVDVLAGAGANRDTANQETVASASLGAVAGSKLTLNVTNAGNSKQGTVYIYIR